MDVKNYVCLAAVLVMSAVLFIFAALFGAPGGLLGMYVFHHKTRHWYFRWGFALLTAAQCTITYFILR